MKNILLASTALVAFAGAAAAEVKVIGYAEMGIAGGSEIETQFHNDIWARFMMSGTTDGGLEFGARVDYDDSNGADEVNSSAAFPPAMDDEMVWISGAFGKVTLGETDGAFDWAMTEAAHGTAIGDDHSIHAGFNGNDGLDDVYDNQVMRYEYAMGDFSFAGSAEIDDSGVGDAALGLGVKYATEMSGTKLGFGVAYQTVDTNTLAGDFGIWGLSATAAMDNGFKAILNYSDLDGYNGNDSHMGVALAYQTGALLVGANYGSYNRVVGADVDGWGLIANYDLGGGAKVMAGYGDDDTDNTWSVGLGLTF